MVFLLDCAVSSTVRGMGQTGREKNIRLGFAFLCYLAAIYLIRNW